MTFANAVISVLSQYVGFSGRAGRSEYWYWILFVLVLFFLLSRIEVLVLAPLLGFEANDSAAGQPLRLIASIALLLPALAVAVRRLHDIDRSGWWFLIGLTGVGVLVLIYWFVQPGTHGPNQYGESDTSRARDG